jgi:hypothetical protein
MRYIAVPPGSRGCGKNSGPNPWTCAPGSHQRTWAENDFFERFYSPSQGIFAPAGSALAAEGHFQLLDSLLGSCAFSHS